MSIRWWEPANDSRLGFALQERQATSAHESRGLILSPASLTSAAMSFYVAVLAWLVMAAVLAAGIVMATHGKLLLLIVGVILFVFAFGKWGCATHD